MHEHEEGTHPWTTVPALDRADGLGLLPYGGLRSFRIASAKISAHFHRQRGGDLLDQGRGQAAAV